MKINPKYEMLHLFVEVRRCSSNVEDVEPLMVQYYGVGIIWYSTTLLQPLLQHAMGGKLLAAGQLRVLIGLIPRHNSPYLRHSLDEECHS